MLHLTRIVTLYRLCLGLHDTPDFVYRVHEVSHTELVINHVTGVIKENVATIITMGKIILTDVDYICADSQR